VPNRKSKTSKNTKKSNLKKTAPKLKIKARSVKAPKTLKKPKMTKAEIKKGEEQLEQQRQVEESRETAVMLENRAFMEHIDTKVGHNTTEILKSLVKAPKTDEDIATQLNMKVNDVRRTLNIMNSYSIVRYDVNKDSKGWLIFKWKLNQEKLKDYISKMEAEMTAVEEPTLQSNCNDFFICKKCYTSQKVVLPFDSAFESGFNCDSCGKPYTILNRNEVVELFKTQK